MVETTSSFLFIDTFPGVPRPDRTWRAIRFDLGSGINLAEYFESWDREIQVRCAVEAPRFDVSYFGHAFGPFQGSLNVSKLGRGQAGRVRADADGVFRYVVYAFLDLKAVESDYEAGHPRSSLDLENQDFESLSCHLLGVTKAPVLFPRSNSFSVKASDLRAQFRSRPGSPN